MNHRLIQNRDHFPWWLNENGLTGIGVEVGSAYGGYARKILEVWKGKRLFLVDGWRVQPSDICPQQQETQERFTTQFNDCLKVSSEYPHCTPINAWSEEAADYFRDRLFDFVYIDANHSYDAVMYDLRRWWMKVKQGGILCGHDFYNRIDGPYHNEVERAVTEWTASPSEDIHVTPCTSWWIKI